MARAFDNSQRNALLNAFGESIDISGVQYTVILEEQQIVLEDSDGVATDYRHYFTGNTAWAFAVGTQFNLNNITYIIYSIEDDLSGIKNYYYRRKDYDSWS